MEAADTVEAAVASMEAAVADFMAAEAGPAAADSLEVADHLALPVRREGAAPTVRRRLVLRVAAIVLRPPSSAGRPSSNSSRPATGNSGNYRPPTGNFAGGANAARDGQWHAFGPRTGVGPVGGPVFGGFGGGVGFRGSAGDRPGLGFGFPYQNRFRFGGFRGGFGPGWGWGGWGFGWGGLGLGWGLGFNSCWGFGWTWDPFCDGFAAWSAYPGYGYGGYGYSGAYPYPPSVNYDPNYSPDSTGNYPQPSDSVTPTAPSLIEPNSDTSANLPGAAAQSEAAVVIYLKDGSSILPTDYWMADDQFHYLVGGREYIVPLSRVDLQKTNDVNHQNGATFRLKSAPDNLNAVPGPGASTAPAPDQLATPGSAGPDTGAAPATL